MAPHYAPVAERAGHRCEYCHAPEVIFNFPFEVEHILPVSAGGLDDFYNYALACRSCNFFKAAHLLGIDPETGLATRLFHPRLDVWAEHFHIPHLDRIIHGLTAIGRATATCLQMNHALQIAARKAWMRLGLFP